MRSFEVNEATWGQISTFWYTHLALNFKCLKKPTNRANIVSNETFLYDFHTLCLAEIMESTSNALEVKHSRIFFTEVYEFVSPSFFPHSHFLRPICIISSRWGEIWRVASLADDAWLGQFPWLAFSLRQMMKSQVGLAITRNIWFPKPFPLLALIVWKVSNFF